MQINDNGVYREMTQEEIRKMEDLVNSLPKLPPSVDERLSSVESAIRMLLLKLQGGKKDV